MDDGATWADMTPLERLAYLEKHQGRLPDWIRQAAQEAQAVRDQERRLDA